MEISTDYFDRLPDEVIQLIFSAISDCKSLVRCMSVSKAFRQQSIRATSLSIVCPGSFSSYDERLDKIYSMVKGFRNLQTLVVRVGQPKEEPPSWARCMRYAEIGGSVEKFVFMAAKSGDFSELDFTLLGLENMTDKDNYVQGADPSDSTGGGTMSATSSGMGFLVDNIEETQQTHIRPSFRKTQNGGDGNGSSEAWSDIDSDEDIGHRDESGEMESNHHNEKSVKSCNYGKFIMSSELFLEGPGHRRQLSDFNLRQVIAPSAEILQRMLPVIHFAIVQGLNELRDSLPAFVSQFPDLRTFLLVDMVESITVYMREHNIQDIRASYLEELNEWDNKSSEVLNEVEVASRRLEQDKREGQAMHKVDIEGRCGKDACGELDTITATGIDRVAKEGSLKGVSSFALDDCHTQDIDGARDFHSQGDDDCWSLKSTLRDQPRKGKELVNEVHVCNSRFPRSCQLDILESNSQQNAVCSKGKGKLPEYPNQIGQSFLSDGPPHTNSAPLHDWRSSQVSDHVCFENCRRESAGDCQDRNGKAHACEDFAEAQEENLELNSSEDSDGVTDVEDYSMECLDSRHSGVHVGDIGLDTCDDSNQVRDFQASMEVKGDVGELTTANTERGINQLPRLRHVEGWDGDYIRERKDVWKSCVFSREAKLDLTSRHPFKRGQRIENLRVKDSNRVFRVSLDCHSYNEVAHGNRCSKLMSRAEAENIRINLDIERNTEICKEVGAETQFGLHRTTAKVSGTCCIQDSSVLQTGASCSRFDDSVPLILEDTASSESDRDSWKQFLALEQGMPKESGAALNSGVDVSIPDSLPEGNCGSPLLCNSREPCSDEVHQNGITSNTIDNSNESNGLAMEVTGDPQLEGRITTERPRVGYGSMLLESRRSLVEGPVGTDVWRYAWRERVRRLRDNLRHACSQGEQERNREERRERSREVFRKRQRDLEKDALSFDYTFWRAEKVAASNYTLSDISMCIATNGARPLRDADKEILKHAALSGPLLVATVLHVNKHHTSHNL